MFAIIKTGGKQYKVKVGSVIEVDNLNVEENGEVLLDVLMISGDSGVVTFNPESKAKATVLLNFRGEKVIAFKKRRRHTYKRKKGFRHDLTKIKITSL